MGVRGRRKKNAFFAMAERGKRRRRFGKKEEKQKEEKDAPPRCIPFSLGVGAAERGRDGECMWGEEGKKESQKSWCVYSHCRDSSPPPPHLTPYPP